MIAQHPYGNYVISTALEETKEREAFPYQKLCCVLYRGLNHRLSNPYGRIIANLLKEQSCEAMKTGFRDTR